jgi:hypothetical protein
LYDSEAVRQAHWSYVSNALESTLEEGNSKPFWKYIKSKRTDNIGVAGIKKIVKYRCYVSISPVRW